MKIRTSFVSNSSSSSFVLDKRVMTEEQIAAIHDHIAYAEKHFPGQFYTGHFDHWGIDDDGDTITAYTHMDNFDMEMFLRLIGVPQAAILKEDDDWK